MRPGSTLDGGVAPQAAPGIFISYRRQEANYLAGWLHDCLADHFGEARVFLDIDWIRPGVDFMQVITQAIARSEILLVLIGPRWLERDRDGNRRLDRPDDPVRVEISTALKRNIRIIPLLLDGAAMPRAGDLLPDDLAALTRLNAVRVGYDDFRSDVAQLVKTLDEEFGIVVAPVADPATKPADSRPGPRPKQIRNRAVVVDAQRDEKQRARLLIKLRAATPPATPPPIPDTAGPGPPTPPPPGWSAPWQAGPWAGQTPQVQTGEDDITGSWFKIAWLRNLSIYQEPSHLTASTRRPHPNPAKPDERAIAQIAPAPSARSLQESHTLRRSA